MRRYRPQMMIMMALALLFASCSADSVFDGDEASGVSGGPVLTEAPTTPMDEQVPLSSAVPEESESTMTTSTAEASSAASEGASRGEEEAEPPGEKVVDEPEPDPVVGEVPAGLLDAVLADAAKRLGSSAYEVTRAEYVEWPDGSLGCPEPGVMYTMATTPGYWIEIESGTTLLDYRMTEAGYFTLCESPGIAPPTTGGDS